MHNFVHMANVMWKNFTLQCTPLENAKLKCSEISILPKLPNYDAAKM